MKVSGSTISYNSPEFKKMFERHFPAMSGLASRILKSEERGKDVAQEAFVKLWEKDDEEFADQSALRAYLYVLVKNACIDRLRKEKKNQQTSIEEGLTVQSEQFLNEILREETYQLLYNAIQELSPQAEEVVRLTMQGFTNQEIADQLDVTINTVKTVKKRAYKSLREKLGYQYVTIMLTSFIEFF